MTRSDAKITSEDLHVRPASKPRDECESFTRRTVEVAGAIAATGFATCKAIWRITIERTQL
jgi:hypothetical protein